MPELPPEVRARLLLLAGAENLALRVAELGAERDAWREMARAAITHAHELGAELARVRAQARAAREADRRARGAA